MGISKNVFLRKGVRSTLYFNRYNDAQNETWGDGLGTLDAVTYSFFLKLRTSTSHQNIIGDFYQRIQVRFGGSVLIGYKKDDGYGNLVGVASFNEYYNEWTHLLLVRDFMNKNIIFCINSNIVYVSPILDQMTYYLADNFTISCPRGNMAFIKIYNRVPSGNEIKLLSKNYPISRVGLIGEWGLNEGSGSICYDKSGRGKNLTLAGCVWNNDKPF